ncbi:Hydrogenase maturation factor [Thermoanaerobacter thermohydrosulfuricus WC1]|uniref:Hydrogenase maturation factor n=1 Tax=Thermoanaerobacter thermohydrosulfuricus WC1 TaxID=1198630 RepID=M8CWX6_THETY|nr:AIR synthase family protein [Thermoanaerobacter thermohydrosulfuricus]EMT38869.1 Hydrogenase maturation factor [Thermoanaerobacter thermohydrosulfuricus WC1]
MEVGKVPVEILKRSVFPYLGVKRKEVLVHSQLGEDSSIIDFGEYVAVLSTDPITAAEKLSGFLSVIISCNDLASCGAKPIGILSTILLPEGTEEATLHGIMKEIDRAAKKLSIEVLGGHTEITSTVNKPIISTTAIGIAKKGEYITTKGAKIGDDVIVTKALGLEGTAILATDYEDLLLKGYNKDFVLKAQNFINEISVIEEGLIAAQNGANAMHDITEGGILGAAYEIAEASGLGIEIYEEKLPIRPETKEICRFFDINPLKLISSGSMIITASNGDKIVKSLSEKGIQATIIGKIIKEGKYLITSKGKEEITPPERDEIYLVNRERIKV